MKAEIPVRKLLPAVRGIGERDWGFRKMGFGWCSDLFDSISITSLAQALIGTKINLSPTKAFPKEKCICNHIHPQIACRCTYLEGRKKGRK